MKERVTWIMEMQFSGSVPVGMRATACTGFPLDKTSHCTENAFRLPIHLKENDIKKMLVTSYIYLNSFLLIFEEVKEILFRKGKPKRGGCTNNEAVRLAWSITFPK